MLAHELSFVALAAPVAASESLEHYHEATNIAAFPVRDSNAPAIPQTDIPEVASPASAAEKRIEPKARPGWLALGGAGSAFTHALIISVLVVAITATPQDPEEEAGDTVSVIMLGNAEFEKSVTGAQIDQAEIVEAQAVQSDELAPEETAEPVSPVTPELARTEVAPVAAAEAVPVDAAAAEQTVATEMPEPAQPDEPATVSSEVPAEASVAQPAQRDEHAPVAPAEQAEEPVQPPPAIANPVAPSPRPTPPSPQPEKPVKKKIAARQSSGRDGDAKSQKKKGSEDGSEPAAGTKRSQSDRARLGEGSAAVASYPGKVQAKIRRSVRVPAVYRRAKEPLSVRIRLSIESGGGLQSATISRSSGFPDLDQAVLEGVRRAAPFPALPSEWSKPVWTFTQELQITSGR